MTKDLKDLVQDLRDEDKKARQEAAQALGQLETSRAVDPLIAALADGDLDVRRSVAEALVRLGFRSVNPLIAALEGESAEVREAAAKVLGLLKNTEAVNPLVAALRDETWRVRQAAAEALAARPNDPPRVLVIDDCPDLLKIMQVSLSDKGLVVEDATDGYSGIQMAWEYRPDVILLDVMMPNLDGFETYELLRKITHVPIIFVTARSHEDDVIKGLLLGADDYICKPFNIPELVSRLRAAIRRASSNTDETTTGLEKEIERLRLQRLELLRRIEAQETSNGTRIAAVDELSSLVSGIVHDLRGGLGVIRNTAGFMLDDVNQDETLATDLDKVIRTTEFCELVIRNLMSLGGDAVFEPVEVNIEEVVHDVYFMLERKLVDVKLNVDTAPETPTIRADEGQMKQVFMNLIKNAGEAMPEGGTLTVRTHREGQLLCIEVSDTGCGISPEDQERLFQEFFTTKERGYGLGLHIVHTIVKRHGGTIEVESEVDKGTTFVLHLPIEQE